MNISSDGSNGPFRQSPTPGQSPTSITSNSLRLRSNSQVNGNTNKISHSVRPLLIKTSNSKHPVNVFNQSLKSTHEEEEKCDPDDDLSVSRHSNVDRYDEEGTANSPLNVSLSDVQLGQLNVKHVIAPATIDSIRGEVLKQIDNRRSITLDELTQSVPQSGTVTQPVTTLVNLDSYAKTRRDIVISAKAKSDQLQLIAAELKRFLEAEKNFQSRQVEGLPNQTFGTLEKQIFRDPTSGYGNVLGTTPHARWAQATLNWINQTIQKLTNRVAPRVAESENPVDFSNLAPCPVWIDLAELSNYGQEFPIESSPSLTSNIHRLILIKSESESTSSPKRQTGDPQWEVVSELTDSQFGDA